MLFRSNLKKLVLIGFGDIAQSEHLPAIQASADFSLEAIIEVKEERREEARKTGAPIFESLDEIDSIDFDAAIITTPPEITPILAAQCLRRGIHVLIEKPIANSVQEAEQLSSLITNRPQTLQVGFVNRFSPAILELRELIDTGKLGNPLTINMGAFDETLDENNPAHFEKIISFLSNGSSFAHEGSHLLDYLRFLGFGDPEITSVNRVKTDSRFPSANYVNTGLSFSDGSIAFLEVGWMMPKLPIGYIRILGPLGMVEIIRRKGEMKVDLIDESRNMTLPKPWNSLTFPAQLAALSNSIDGESTIAANLEDGIWNLKLMERLETKKDN